MNAPFPLADAILLEGARVILDDRVEQVSVRISHGVITGLDVAADGAVRRNLRGLVLAPAMVDIHGDAFERQLMPRPGVSLPTEDALLETDRQLAANGIATAYHALTLGWEPGLRSLAAAWDIVETLQRLAPRLTVEHRLQLRWETFCFEALPLIETALEGPLAPSIAFNDHTSMAVLHADTPLQQRPFEHDPAFPVADLASPDFASRMKARAARSMLSTDDYLRLMAGVWRRRPLVPPMIAEVAARGRAAGVPMLSHDDSRPETRSFYRVLGARICEFPMNEETARAAREAGDRIAFGAPNAARGGSHLGSPAASAMLSAGLCDMLASDYSYPSLLAAVARLRAEGAGTLPELWRLVAAHPAAAMGLADRGRIAPGLRADLVAIEWPEGRTPAPRATWVAGRAAHFALAAG